MNDNPSNDLRALKGAAKMARIPIKIAPTTELKRKPAWIRAKSPNSPEV
ncbi:MAG: lipoyl synthase, partial [Gammaproteobacteria bacterium]